MMDSVPNLSDAVTHYASHCLRSNVKFSDIEKIMQSMKIDPSIVYMFQDHKQRVLQIRYQEVQVEYFG